MSPANFFDSAIFARDLTGAHVWSDQFDSYKSEFTSGITVDHTGVYLAGVTGGTLPFHSHYNLDEGSFDAYLIGYGFNGARVWSRQFDASGGPVYVNDIASDGNGIYLAGYVFGSSTFPGEQPAVLNDAFVREYKTDGTLGGTRMFGTAGHDYIDGIAIDNTGVYVTGNTTGAFPGHTRTGTKDAFAAKLNVVPTPHASIVEQEAPPSTPLDESQDTVKAAEYQGDPVNVLFGNFTHQHTDLATAGLGLGWTRTYNSSLPRSGLVGHGWSIAWDIAVGTDPDDFTTVRRGDGRVDRYRSLGGGAYTGPLGSVDRLTRSTLDGTYTLTTRERITYRFDAAGRLQSATDRDGNVVTLTWTNGKWTGIRDAAGRTSWTITYAAAPNSGRIATVTDNARRVVRYSYEADGDLASVTDANGGITRYTYDGQHRITRITDPLGHLFVSHIYDPEGRVVTQTDARGTHRFSYFPNHTVYTDPLGHRTTTHFDDSHRITKLVDALGSTTTMTYHATGQVATETDALGRTTRYAYDGRGNLTTVTDPSGNVTTMRYSTDGRDVMLSRTDALGRTDRFSHDSKGRVIKAEERDGTAQERVTQYAYTAKGLLCREVIDSAAVDLQALADPCATAVAGTATTNVSTRYEYDAAGNRTKTIDPLGRATTYRYDGVGRVTTTTDALGRRVTTSFDALGQVLATRTFDPLAP